MEGTWIEVRVITKSEALEPISGIFYSLDCKGVAIEDPEDFLGTEKGPSTWDFADINILEHKGKVAVVKGYFSDEDNISSIIEFVKEKVEEIKNLGIDVGEGKVEHEKMHEEDWANNWKKYYKPTLIGDRIVIKPIWEDYKQKDNEIIIELDPGMAFGTGEHETTRMCIKALEQNVKENSTVFDVGCGSGILSIVAAKLKAKEVIGVDLDPVAVKSAIDNVSFNDISNIKIIEGNLLDVVSGKADIVVANIIAEVICILTEDVKKAINKGGLFITSGIIHDRVEMVSNKLTESGFQIIHVEKDGEWNCITARLK